MSKFFHDPRACEVCGEEFTPLTRLHILCSDICRQNKSRQVAAAWYAANADHHISSVLKRRTKKKKS